MSKRLRPPSNLDDDEAVERYLARVRKEEAKSAEDREAARTSGLDANAIEADVANKVAQVVANIIAGDSACPVESAYLFVNRADELGAVDSVRVVVVQDLTDKDQRINGTPDFKLFERLFQENEWSPSASSERVLAFERSAPTVAAAMPRIVEAGVKAGIVPAADAARLTSLYAAWMAGVPWSRMRLSATNRPSLASWPGTPWELSCVKDTHLSRGVTGAAVTILTEMAPPEAFAPPALLASFVPLWTKEAGAVADIPGVVHAAVAAWLAAAPAARRKMAAPQPPARSAGAGKRGAAAAAKPAKAAAKKPRRSATALSPAVLALIDEIGGMTEAEVQAELSLPAAGARERFAKRSAAAAAAVAGVSPGSRLASGAGAPKPKPKPLPASGPRASAVAPAPRKAAPAPTATATSTPSKAATAAAAPALSTPSKAQAGITAYFARAAPK